MHDWLRQKIGEYITLSDEAWQYFSGFLLHAKLNTGDNFFRAGEVATKAGFLKNGILRAYYIDSAGQTTTSYFYYQPQNNIVALHTSFTNQSISQHTVEALTESEILYIERDAIHKCLDRYPVFERLMRKIAEQQYLSSSQRSHDLQTKSAKELYLDFINNSGNLILKVPQHMIASYLGMSQYTLSKIKKEI